MAASPNERYIVLAASYPPREYKAKADSHEIAAAVRALIGAAFQESWKIIFGGHPTISPLVLTIARIYGVRNSVIIFQSSYFANHLGQATLSLSKEQFGQIFFTPTDPFETPPGPHEIPNPTSCPRSLAAMRKTMLSHPNIAGLVLIGGDSGLKEEFKLFREMLPAQPVVPIGFPGGAAAELINEAQLDGMSPELRAALASSRNYLFLCSRIVRYLSERRT